MLFPSSGVESSLFLPPLAAFAVSVVTSMGGVSGAFLLLPFQVSILGYASPSVSATNHVFNIVATPGGVYRYFREGRLLLPLAAIAILASLPGVLFGSLIRLQWLADAGRFKCFAGLVLLCLALRLLRDLLGSPSSDSAPGAARPLVLQAGLRRVVFSFRGEEHAFKPWALCCLTAAVGLIGGIYGIGGGSILSPFLVSVFRLPVHVIAGPTLLCTLVTSLGGVAASLCLAPLYPGLSVRPDWSLGLLFGLGGLAGMYCGARLQKYLPPAPIKCLLALTAGGAALSWLLPHLAG